MGLERNVCGMKESGQAMLLQTLLDDYGPLRSRLARGEITPEEFERARSLLAAGPTIEGKAHR